MRCARCLIEPFNVGMILIYLKSFIRRLKVKSALYFSLPVALVVLVCTRSPKDFLLTWSLMTLSLYFLGFLINQRDKKKQTNIHCKLCGYQHCSLLYPARKKKKTEEIGSFACSSFDHAKYPDIYYCPECHNGFLDWLGKDDVQAESEKGIQLYEDVEDTEYIKNLPARFLTNQKLVEKYLPHFKGKDVLEVGSYYGAFLSEVKKVAGSVTGIEPSKHAVNYLKEQHSDIDVFQGTLERYVDQYVKEGKKFDTVVLWDVIEHVPDPILTLKNINKLLKPGGIVIFSTINIESSFSLILGPMWPWFMDMHYYYFSDRGYVDMLHRSGYVMENHNHYSYYVYLSYFINKAVSMVFSKFRLPQSLENSLRKPVRITFGDTVAIIGKKTD